MIASWMIYTLLVGGLVCGAALAAERALLLLRLPVRGVWATALSLSLLVPCLAHFFLRTVAIPPAVERVMRSAAVVIAPSRTAAPSGPWAAESTGIPIQQALLVGWVVVSLGLTQLALVSMAVLYGRRREWRRATVDGVEALVAPDFGPAVVGWRRLEIVLPAWALELAGDARLLVVRHEQEHVRRADPRLLIHASLVVLAMPWNPALWWQYRRLRRAIELDCDQRVVRGGADVARYGEVLLEAGGFCRRGGLPALASFAERAGDLEVRIKALTPRRGRWRVARIGAAVLAAGMMVTAACLVPDPLSPSKELSRAVASSSAASAADTTSLTTWVQSELRGIHTILDIVLFRSHEGKLLGSRYVRGTFDNVAEMVSPDDIDRIEVVKGQAVPNVGSVVVITLKPGKQLAAGTDDSFRRYIKMASGCAALRLGRVTIYRTKDIDGIPRCR